MSIILIGLNHRTAPVELREKLALNGCALQMTLEELRDLRDSKKHRTGAALQEAALQEAALREVTLQEVVILSTCNRLEIYAVVRQTEAGFRLIEGFLAGLQNIPLDELEPHLYLLEGLEAVSHLMRVACGLDSMILGESQILGQVTQAFGDAQAAGLTGPVLSHLMSQAIHAGKCARTDTDISRHTTSVSHAAALLVQEKAPHIVDPHVLVIGAGEMARLSAVALQSHGLNHLSFINRTHNRAQKLAAEFGGLALGWHQLAEALTQVDAVITATGAPHLVIFAQTVADVLHRRCGRPLLFVDIAVPRDVEVSVGDLDGVARFDIDDLRSIVDANAAQREAAVPQVDRIIMQQVDAFMAWYHSRDITPVIQSLRQWAADVAQVEVEQALNKLSDSDAHTAEIVNRLAHRIVNKLLHEPTVRLRGQAAEGNGYGYAHAVSELFALPVEGCKHHREAHEQGQPMVCSLECITHEHAYRLEGNEHQS